MTFIVTADHSFQVVGCGGGYNREIENIGRTWLINCEETKLEKEIERLIVEWLEDFDGSLLPCQDLDFGPGRVYMPY